MKGGALATALLCVWCATCARPAAARAGGPVEAARVPGIEFPAQIHFQVEDPGTVVRSHPWLVRVLTNGPAGVDRVYFHWAVGAAPRFQTRLMDELGPGYFELRLPGAETDAASLNYFFTAWDQSGNASAELGSAESPLSLRTDPGAGARGLLAAGLVAAVIGAILAAGMVHESGRRRRDLDRLFWLVTLRSLAALDEVERERRLREIASREVFHPVEGLRCFPTAFLRKRLDAVGDEPLERLLGGSLLGYRALLEQQRGFKA